MKIVLYIYDAVVFYVLVMWLLRLNIDKCKSASYCLKHPIDTQYHIMDNNKIFPLEKVKSMVDLGEN